MSAGTMVALVGLAGTLGGYFLNGYFDTKGKDTDWADKYSKSLDKQGEMQAELAELRAMVAAQTQTISKLTDEVSRLRAELKVRELK